MRTLMITTLFAILATMQTGGSDLTRLERTTDLASAPDGTRIGVLMDGASVRVLERRGQWARVSVDGWILYEGDVPAAPFVAAAPETSLSASVTLTGQIYIPTTETTAVGSGVLVRLLPGDASFEPDLEAIATECAARREPLRDEADRLLERASKAMRLEESPSDAWEISDEAKAERRGVLRKLRDLDRECSRREDEVLDEHAVRRVVSTADGRYAFDDPDPGEYVIVAELPVDKDLHRWAVKVTLSAGNNRLDLTDGNVTGTEPIPVYR